VGCNPFRIQTKIENPQKGSVLVSFARELRVNTFLVFFGQTTVKQPKKLVGLNQVCSKFLLSPAIVRTSQQAARLLASVGTKSWEKVYTY
jgi:hypothetical protein